MVARSGSLFAAIVSISHAQCSGPNIVGEDGSETCLPATEPVKEEEGEPNKGVGAQYISAKTCFQQYCKSTSIRNALVDACKQRKFDDCDSLTYHDTFLKNIATNQYTYDFVGGIDYDENHATTVPFSQVSWNVQYDNGGSETDVSHISHKIGRSSSSSWTSEQDFTFEEDIEISVTAGLPLTVEVKTDITDKFTIGTKNTQTHSEAISQDYTITDDMHIAPKSCDNYCVFESDEDTQVPYTLRGDFKSSGIIPNEGAYMCCYLRKGGAGDCNWGGHSGAGWMVQGTAGTAARWGTAQGNNQCPHIIGYGKSARINLPGTWAGGMKLSHNVVKYESPTGHCPECPQPSTSNLTAVQSVLV